MEVLQMKMYETIKKELLKNENMLEYGKELDISELDVLNHLKEHEVDIKEIFEDIKYYENENLEEEIDNTFFLNYDNLESNIQELQEYQKRKEKLNNLDIVENFDELLNNKSLDDYYNLCDSDNSYNWNSSATFQFQYVEIKEVEYVAIKFHISGDVRTNYTYDMLLDTNFSDNEFLEELNELRKNISFKYQDYTVHVSSDVTSELFDIYIENDNESNDYQEYIDCDYNNFNSIKESVIKFLGGVINV